MRVLVTAPYLGGAGGSERSVYSILRAFQYDNVDLIAWTHLGGPWAEVGSRVHVHSPRNWRWRGARSSRRMLAPIAKTVVNPIRRLLRPKYDLHIAQMNGPDLVEVSRATLRVMIPCGNPIGHSADDYDFVGLEAPDNKPLAGAGLRSVLLPPPLLPLANVARSPNRNLPRKFLLTVFNPYNQVKGADDLSVVADTAPLPIVWCHSRRTLAFSIEPHLARHPNIIHVDDPSPVELRFLYEKCAAYLSFSRSEGFGWAAADALRYSQTVVTRPVGVFSFPESRQDGVHLVGDRWEFDWSLLPDRSGSVPRRDLQWLSPEAFRDRVSNLVLKGGASRC